MTNKYLFHPIWPRSGFQPNPVSLSPHFFLLRVFFHLFFNVNIENKLNIKQLLNIIEGVQFHCLLSSWGCFKVHKFVPVVFWHSWFETSSSSALCFSSVSSLLHDGGQKRTFLKTRSMITSDVFLNCGHQTLARVLQQFAAHKLLPDL